jgi:creatinine amidohydrolase/Fe(II)-dependent formamide hydrolase-like protein
MRKNSKMKRVFLICLWIFSLNILLSFAIAQNSEPESQNVMFKNLTFREIEMMAKKGVPVFIPVAQIEAHGPHLPVGAHLYCAEEICQKAAISAGGLVGVPITLGNCSDFSYWPGYIIVDTQTLISIFKYYCESLRNQGFKRLIFFCCMGGNVFNTLRLAAGEYFKRHPEVDIVLVTLAQVLNSQTIQMIQKQQAEMVTSIMLLIKPELVHMERLGKVKIKGSIGELRKAFRFREGYRLSEFFPDAVNRVYKGSSGEIGLRIIKEAANTLVELSKER